MVNYQKLYKQAMQKTGRKVHAGVIGSGHYGTAVITQSFSCDYLKIPIIADHDIEKGRLAYARAGLSDDQVTICTSAPEALAAIEAGKYVVVQDPMILMDLPLDVITESTGIAQVAAKYGLAAIENGKNLAMINKEADSTIGPILQHLANKNGLVYTQVDGDQHGLMIGLINWARTLGLEIISAGKSRDAEFVLDRSTGIVKCAKDGINVFKDHTKHLTDAEIRLFDELPHGKVSEYLAKRREILHDFPFAKGNDLCEMLIAINASGLAPDIPELHNPLIHLIETPQVLCGKEDGGILNRMGTVDVTNVFRNTFETGLGGGVFIVVSCKNEYSRMIVQTKGCFTNKSGNAALIYRPYHLCGVETITSLICAGLLGISTGSDTYQPRYDIVQTAATDLKEGYVFGDDHDPLLNTTMIATTPMGGKNAVPAHMLQFNKLLHNVPAGSMITYDMVDTPEDSVMWRLREQQDKVFISS